MALATEHSFSLVPKSHCEVRDCIERLAPRSSQELEAAAGAAERDLDTLSIRACLKSLRTVAGLGPRDSADNYQDPTCALQAGERSNVELRSGA